MSNKIAYVYRRVGVQGIVLLILLVSMSVGACGANPSAGAAPVASIPTIPPTQHCGTVLLDPRGNPTDVVQAQKINACFWHAYQKCLPATLVLRTGGVDTITQRTFTIEKKGCALTDAVQHAIVPRPLLAAHMYSCAGVTKNSDSSLLFKRCGNDGNITIPVRVMH